MASRAHAPSLSVVVVGAGPVGLTAALSLAKKGHRVRVIERRPELPKGGGDIQLSPNGTRTLRRLGLEAYVRHVMNPRVYFTARSCSDFSVTTRNPIDLGDKMPSLMFRRADLSEALFSAAIEAGVQIDFAKRVVAVNEAKPSVACEDGEELGADIIVAADGVASSMRSLIFYDRSTKPIALDEVCFQWSTPYSVMAEEQDTRDWWEEGKSGFGIVCADGVYLTYWTNEATNSFFTIFSKPGYNGPIEVGSWTKCGDLDEMRSLFAPYFCTPVSKVIERATTCELWRIADSVEGANWVSPSGKIVLVGDAIHTMPPNLGQGLSQGVEDVATLGVLLDAIETTDDIQRLLEEFPKIRVPRVNKIMQASRNNAALFTLPPGTKRDARDRGWRSWSVNEATVKAFNEAPMDSNADSGDYTFMKWVQHYDALSMAEEHLSKHKL